VPAKANPIFRNEFGKTNKREEDRKKGRKEGAATTGMHSVCMTEKGTKENVI